MGKQDIKYDQRNYRDHDDRNLSLIKKSIQRCGAGRSIADLTLNLYSRYLAKQFLKKNKWNVPVFCDIACAIGRRDIEICLHDGQGTIYKRYTERKSPQTLIKQFKLDTPIYAHLCREGLFSGI